jgi:hypothetical protein
MYPVPPVRKIRMAQNPEHIFNVGVVAESNGMKAFSFQLPASS